MMIRTLKQIVATAAAVALVLGVSACTPEVPLVSETTPLSNETIDEQRAWVEEEADAAVIASGIADGWHQRGHVPEENIAWSGLQEDRSQVIGRLSPIECSGAGTGALNLGLNNDTAVEDATAIADGMRAFWESEGWTISDITPPSSNEVYFRADREDGAILGFRATPTGLLIRVTSTCSAHASVTNAFGASGETNAFEVELAAREQTAISNVDVAS